MYITVNDVVLCNIDVICVCCSCTCVAYLECDVGQTEFTAPGCVALHLITTPVLGQFTALALTPYLFIKAPSIIVNV